MVSFYWLVAAGGRGWRRLVERTACRLVVPFMSGLGQWLMGARRHFNDPRSNLGEPRSNLGDHRSDLGDHRSNLGDPRGCLNVMQRNLWMAGGD